MSDLYVIRRAVALVLAGLGMCGCSSGPKPMLLESHFAQITVGQTSTTEVLNRLPDKGMLHTADSVSVLHAPGWSQELGIVQFNATESVVERKNYLQIRSGMGVPPFVKERFSLSIQTTVDDALLAEPYENEMRRNTAILRFCHDAMVSDARPFEEDQTTINLIGLARNALDFGIHRLTQTPRQASELYEEGGYAYVHPTLGKCRLYLTQDDQNIFSLTLAGNDTVDPVNTW